MVMLKQPILNMSRIVLETDVSNIVLERRLRFPISSTDRIILEKEKKIKKIMEEKNVPKEEAEKILKEEDREKELSGGFMKVLYYLRGGINFYRRSICVFAFIAFCCFIAIWLIFKFLYNIPAFHENAINEVIIFGIFMNFRFFVFQFLIITLLIYCIKRILNYISMIEVYKEIEIFLIMDAQRQAKHENKKEQRIVSVKFQEKFSELIVKHEDSFLKRKDELKIKSLVEVINLLQKK